MRGNYGEQFSIIAIDQNHIGAQPNDIATKTLFAEVCWDCGALVLSDYTIQHTEYHQQNDIQVIQSELRSDI